MAREEAKPRNRASREIVTQMEEVDESITLSESEVLKEQSAAAPLEGQSNPVTIQVRFFDESTLHPIDVQERDLHLEFRPQNAESWSLVKMTKSGEDHNAILAGARSENNLFEIRLQPFEEKCVRYLSQTVTICASSSRKTDCGTIPMPVFRLEESCTLKIHTHDSSCRKDDDQQFLDDVEVRITPMKTSAHASSSTGSHSRENYSGKTKRGIFAVDVPCRQLYQVEIQPPEGYICKTPAVQNFYICCERNMELKVHLSPCEKTQSHMALLVDTCGNPVPNQQIYLDGRPHTSGSDGQIILRSSVAGRVHIQYPEKQFQPEYLEMTSHEPLFSVIKMSDQPARATLHRGKQRYQFVSEQGQAFAKRKVILESSNGAKTVEWTDSNGFFFALASSTMFADDDDQGLAFGPMVLPNAGE